MPTIKEVRNLTQGDKFHDVNSQEITVLNTGEDRIKQEMIIYWNDWNFRPMRLPFDMQIQVH